MLCDECGKNPAVFSVTIASGGGVSNRHLCAECMKKMESSLTQGNIHSFLSSIMSMLSPAQTENNQLKCRYCGLSYSDFERTGKLGCAGCYESFQEKLQPMLQRIHGSSQHVGRIPAHVAESQGTPSTMATEHMPTQQELMKQRLEELKQKMDEAVAVENFEAAAQYRDEMRALAQEAGEV
ncbi:MAG: UvrB/UvrC motif-containing protein [Clostridia bacterium]|nr:UvrB/UvrC motif-containing protein [Clostridia bacterium]MBP3650333.1 UvrB/UvrC motif-containing protein [Clostridia bacterium]